MGIPSLRYWNLEIFLEMVGLNCLRHCIILIVSSRQICKTYLQFSFSADIQLKAYFHAQDMKALSYPYMIDEFDNEVTTKVS